MDPQTGLSVYVSKDFFHLCLTAIISFFNNLLCPTQNCALLEVRNLILLNSDLYVLLLVNIRWIDSRFIFLLFITLPQMLRITSADHSYRMRVLSNIWLHISAGRSIWASTSMKHDYPGKRYLRQLEEDRFCWKLVYASLVVPPSPLYSEGTCFTEHVANNTAGTAARKVQLPNLEGELLADNTRAGNLSLMQA